MLKDLAFSERTIKLSLGNAKQILEWQKSSALDLSSGWDEA